MMLALALAVSVAGQDIDPVQYKRCDAPLSNTIVETGSLCLGELMLKMTHSERYGEIAEIPATRR